MWPFSRKNKNGSLGLIFDIGSGSVGGSIVSYHQQKPKVVYTKRIPFKISQNISGDKLLSQMKITLNLVLQDIEKEGLKHLNFTRHGNKQFKDARVMLSSPWHISSTKKIEITKGKEFEVTRSLINREIKEEEEKYEKSKEAQEAFSEDGVVVERKIVSIKLNGYQTQNPYGKKVKNLELSVFMSQADKDVLSLIERAILEHFSFESIEFNSFSLAFFSTMRDIYGRMKDFLLIDVTSEVTDVTVAREGAISEIGSFPKGKNFILRKISEAFNTIPEEALSILKIYLEDKSRQGEVKKMSEALGQSKEEWTNSMNKIVSELAGTLSMPSNIFLIADSDIGGWFAEILQQSDYLEDALAEGEVSVRFVNQKTVDGYLLRDKNVTRDSFLSIGALFANKLFGLEIEN